MPTYSHSRLSTFENCPLKYKYQYIDKIEKPQEESVEAFVGSRVHEVFEKLYRELMEWKRNALDELISFYMGEWEKNWGPGIRIVRQGMTQQHYFDYGAKCIRNYYEQYFPFDQARTLEIEAHIAFILDSTKQYTLQGYIDRIALRDDGTYEIHDYKTSQNLPTQADADRDRQLALYQMGIANMWKDADRIDLIWHYVGFKTTIRSRRRPQQLTQLREKTIELIERIEQQQEFKPRKSALCNWCEYKPDCPIWSQTVKVAEAAGR